MAYIYMLHCTGGSLYTGITTDMARRLRGHAAGKGVGAKYTRAHPPLGLAALWEADDLQAAARIEYRLKRLSPQKKRLLVAKPELLGSADFPLPEGLPCRVAVLENRLLGLTYRFDCAILNLSCDTIFDSCRRGVYACPGRQFCVFWRKKTMKKTLLSITLLLLLCLLLSPVCSAAEAEEGITLSPANTVMGEWDSYVLGDADMDGKITNKVLLQTRLSAVPTCILTTY